MPTESNRSMAMLEMDTLVMPFYVVCDVSLSMRDDIGALNEGLARLTRAIIDQPQVDDVARLGVISFSDVARVQMPLGQVSETSLPQLGLEGGTNYGAAFRKVRETLDQDIAQLRADGFQVWRPCVFFMSDGEPLDSDWKATFVSQLCYNPETKVGNKRYPLFVPFGFRSAPQDVIRFLAFPSGKSKWFLQRSARVEDALAGILDVIMKTAMTSALSAGTGQPQTAVQQATGRDLFSGESEFVM